MTNKTVIKEKGKKGEGKKPIPKALTKYDLVLAMQAKIGDRILVDNDNRLALIVGFAPDPEPDEEGLKGVKNLMRLKVEYIDGKDTHGTNLTTIGVKKDSMLKRVIPVEAKKS